MNPITPMIRMNSSPTNILAALRLRRVERPDLRAAPVKQRNPTDALMIRSDHGVSRLNGLLNPAKVNQHARNLSAVFGLDCDAAVRVDRDARISVSRRTKQRGGK